MVYVGGSGRDGEPKYMGCDRGCMVERILRRLNRGKVHRPIPASAQDEYPGPHTAKKPILAVTGTKPDRICTVCLGRLEPGIAITFCNCGKYFHMSCISEIGVCPLCGFVFETSGQGGQYAPVEDNLESYSADNDVVETVYQCPICESYVPEDSEYCRCGAVFDMEDREIYLCPCCGGEVEPDSVQCGHCGMIYET